MSAQRVSLCPRDTAARAATTLDDILAAAKRAGALHVDILPEGVARIVLPLLTLAAMNAGMQGPYETSCSSTAPTAQHQPAGGLVARPQLLGRPLSAAVVPRHRARLPVRAMCRCLPASQQERHGMDNMKHRMSASDHQPQLCVAAMPLVRARTRRSAGSAAKLSKRTVLAVRLRGRHGRRVLVCLLLRWACAQALTSTLAITSSSTCLRSMRPRIATRARSRHMRRLLWRRLSRLMPMR